MLSFHDFCMTISATLSTEVLHTTVSYQLTAEHIKRQSKIDYRSTDMEIVKRIHVPGNLNRKSIYIQKSTIITGFISAIGVAINILALGFFFSYRRSRASPSIRKSFKLWKRWEHLRQSLG
ncbi:hypothetical protein OUZ56_006571 [Daphnia magna]|uniref:Uncharacterized protein n=1 Tax=Daphnia magna TaxID=35525 RepID=A0ABQ9YW28_9CRUS|nr:hypothetical protein OUZ56_006571 [Daphnia magna]